MALSVHESQSSLPVKTVIRPESGWRIIDLAELWRYRDLLRMLALRDLKVRYKQTLVGAAWAILQPLLMMLIFATLFTLMGKRPVSDTERYPVLAFAGLILWHMFATSLGRASTSLVDNQFLVKKIYCPRLVFPLSPSIVATVDFCIAFLLLIGMAAWYGIAPGWHLLAVPLFVLMTLITALAFGLWFASLAAMYRDFAYLVPFGLQVWLFLTPVLYESGAVVPERWRPLYFLNPMAGIIEGFRWAVFGGAASFPWGLALSFVVVAVLLVTGLAYFRRIEYTVADWV